METLDRAQYRLIQQLARIERFENLSLHAALGRILACDIHSAHDVPPSPVSLFDGYALVAPTRCDERRWVAGVTYAGDEPKSLPNGHDAWRIFTGAALPAGANAVIAQEFVTNEKDGSILLHEAIQPHAGVRSQGADSKRGQTILSAGTRLDAAQLGLLASVGVARVDVVKAPCVAVFTTGDELVTPGEPLPPGKIFNSNHTLMCALLSKLNVDVLDMGVLPDDAAAISLALQRGASEADLVLTSGGVSVGDADLVRQAVAQIGSIDTWRVFLKPGKPLAFGRIGSTPFIGLPGNPVSTFVTFFLFVRPALRHMMGADPDIDRPPIQIPLAQPRMGGDRPEFIRVRRQRARDGSTRLACFPDQNSGLLSSISWADGVALIPANTAFQESDLVDYFPFEGWYL